MSSRENLNDNISDTYGFTIGGLDYDLKYPTLTDLEPIAQLNAEREKADEQRQHEIDAEIEEKMYALVTPVGHGTPIQEVLKTQNIKVRNRFVKMLQQQFSAE